MNGPVDRLRDRLRSPVGRARNTVRAGIFRIVGFLEQHKLSILGIIALSVLLFVWKIPEWQLASSKAALGPKDYYEVVNGARTTLAQIVGGTVILIGLYFTWQRIEVAREGQITERFTRAIDQLGSDKLEIRLGAIHALERIARDSEKDHSPIMEVLTAYVRENAPVNEAELDSTDRSKNKPHPPTDIQAIMTVIGRRTRVYGKGEAQRLNLSNVDLQGVDLTSANLQGTHLEQTNLRRANLRHANLQHANLEKANLQEADLGGANLQEANLEEANLKEANLFRARLEGTELWKADLQRAYLCGASLQEAILGEADLKEADLSSADLQEATLSGAKLIRAKLVGAKLNGAFLGGADMLHADLAHADLQGTDFITIAPGLVPHKNQALNLTWMQISSATNGEEARLPDDLQEIMCLKQMLKDLGEDAIQHINLLMAALLARNENRATEEHLAIIREAETKFGVAFAQKSHGENGFADPTH